MVMRYLHLQMVMPLRTATISYGLGPGSPHPSQPSLVSREGNQGSVESHFPKVTVLRGHIFVSIYRRVSVVKLRIMPRKRMQSPDIWRFLFIEVDVKCEKQSGGRGL